MMKKTKTETAINRRIEKLEQQSDLIRKELEGELYLSKKKVKNIGKLAIGIGGGFVAALMLFRLFSHSEDTPDTTSPPTSTRRVYHRFRDQLLGELSNQALLFVLGIAKDKIGQHLNRDIKTESDDSALSE